MISWRTRPLLELDFRRTLRDLSDWVARQVKGPGDVERVAQSPLFLGLCEKASSRMITSLYADTKGTWKEAARQGAEGRRIYLALQRELQGAVGQRVRELIRENARLISTFPLETARKVNATLASAGEAGTRAREQSGYLQNLFRDVSKPRLDMISRTEIHKAATALTRARSEELGIEWYVWMTSNDQRVRAGHRLLDGVLVAWTDPPDPEKLAGERSSGAGYNAGNIYNCRCLPRPLFRLEIVTWPAKVYRNGSIAYWTRTEFERLALKRAA